MKKLFPAVLMAALFTIGCTKVPTAKPIPPCVEGPDDKCVNADFQKEAQKILDYQEKYKVPPAPVPPQDEADRIAGVGVRLEAQRPKDFVWSWEKRHWVSCRANPGLCQTPPAAATAPSK